MAEAAEKRAKARIGTVIRGKYRIESLLATGSMACVYAATHRNASRVALKVLHPHLARDPAMRERFRREGLFANSIAHDGVPRAIDDDETEDGCAYIVMELLEGETLEQRRLRMGGKLPLTFVLTVADTVLDILATAHQHKILHRDLKPDNVFITFGGQVKLLDFGVARWDDQQSSSDMTAAGMVVGTPAFMPPEQALGKREAVDARSDLWAFGATLFIVITGETVHAGGDAKARLIATARTPARKLQEVAPFVPRGVAAVVDRALAFDKKDRWPDALAMREALRWARRSLDAFALDSSNEGELHRRPSLYPGPPSTTRGGFHEEPTRRGISVSDDAAEEDEPTLARAYSDSERDVITSAPSITREVPASEAVRSSAPSGPVFSLRREKREDETDPEIGATTEPQLRVAQPSEPELARTTLPGEMRGMDTLPGEVTPVQVTTPFRAPSEATRTMPFGTPIAAPRPAAGTPAASTPPAMGPPGATTTAIMATPAHPSEAPRHATMKSASIPSDLAEQLAAAAPATTTASSPPGTAAFGSLPPLASSAPPAPSAAATEPTARTSLPPGPVLTTLVKPSRGSVARAAATLAIGVGVLAGATALLVRQQHGKAASTASDVPPPAAASEVPPPVTATTTAAPTTSAAPTATVAATTTPATPSATAPAVPEEPKPEVAMAATHPPPAAPRPRPARPRPRPVASAAAAPSTTDTPHETPSTAGVTAPGTSSAEPASPAPAGAGAATSAPTAEAPKPAPTPESAPPAPKPVPTEDPSLPRVD